MERRIRFATIPEIYKECRLRNFRADVYKIPEEKEIVLNACKAIKAYMAEIETTYSAGLGLYIYSKEKGSGKTRMIASIANELIEKYPVKFATSSQIMNEIRATYGDNRTETENELLNRLMTVDILFIDDFGVEKVTGWVNDKFYSIINERYVSKRITFFTSNNSIEDLEYDERIKSRVQEMTYQIPFPEESVRKTIATKRNAELMGEIK